jgi:hypothetical protein
MGDRRAFGSERTRSLWHHVTCVRAPQSGDVHSSQVNLRSFLETFDNDAIAEKD